MGAQSRAIAAHITERVELLCKALVLEIVANLIRVTPVDTGWARANWIASVTSPATTVDGTPDAVSTSAQQAGIAAVLAFKIDQTAMYVANNVPYINALNYGHSRQAPALFFEYCVDQAIQTVQTKFKDIDLSQFRADYQAQARAKGTAHAVVRAFHAFH